MATASPEEGHPAAARPNTQDLMNSLMMGGSGQQASTSQEGGPEEDLFGGIPTVDPVVPPLLPPPTIPTEPPPPPPTSDAATNGSILQEGITILTEETVPVVNNNTNGMTDINNNIAAIPDVPPLSKPTTSSASTLLAASGLLGPASIESATTAAATTTMAMGGDIGGGLFDDIDAQEEKKQKEEAEEAQRQAAAKAEAERLEAERIAAEEAQKRAAQEQHEQAERLRQQQLQDQMQSIHLGPSVPYGGYPPPNANLPGGYNVGGYPQQQQHPQYQQQQSPMMMYQQPPPTMMMPPPAAAPPPPQYAMGRQQQQPAMFHQGSMMGQPQPQQQGVVDPPVKHVSNSLYQDPPQMSQQQQPPETSNSRYYQPTMLGSPTAGMHSGGGGSMMHQVTVPRPPPIVPMGMYSKVLVTEPLLLQSAPALFGIGQPPHWSYQVTTELSNNGGVWMVRRRFRHVVALEDRLRDDCPGAILPPRPDKHATRAIEEASAHQSAEFAMQRAMELQNYLNLLIHHPFTQQSVVLRLFLALQDDLGTAWPEVSTNALTRLANASVGAAVKVSDSTAAKLNFGTGGSAGMPLGMDDFGEDNAELLALQNAESIRMGAVLQAVPKLEGAVTLLREYAEQSGTVGMELGRLAKDVEVTDRELGQPLDMVSAGMLRAGRRSKRLALELTVALQSYSNQYKLCRYERMAFADRRAAIIRRQKERGKADHRAAQLLLHQRQQQHLAASQLHHQQQHQSMYGNQMNSMAADRLAQDAAVMDDFATDAKQECEEIGRRLKQEINRIAWNRKIEWNASVKVIASSMKEAVTERVAIWETVRESFLTAFPEYKEPGAGVANMPVPNNNAAVVGGGPH